MTSLSLTRERHRALRLLASSQHGANEELLVLGHGFSRRMLVPDLPAVEREVMMAGLFSLNLTQYECGDPFCRLHNLSSCPGCIGENAQAPRSETDGR